MAIFKKRDNGFRDSSETHAHSRDRTVSLGDVAGGLPGTVQDEQIRMLKRDLAEAHAHNELCRFQIKSLRQDMEQIKMDAVISGLGGYPLSAVNPHGERSEPEPQSFDPDTLFRNDPAVWDDARLGEFLDTVSLASAELDAQIASRPAPPAPPDPAALQQNLFAALETVAQLDAEAADLRAQVQNREIQIELLKDRIEIEQQKLHDGFVDRGHFEDLVRQAQALENEKNALAAALQEYGTEAQKLDEYRAARDQAEEHAGDLRMQPESAAQQAEILRTRYDTLKNETIEREEPLKRRVRVLEAQVSHLGGELEQAHAGEETRLAQLKERMRAEYREMQGLMQEYDEAMAGFREQVDSLTRDNAVLKERNRKLAEHVKAVRKQAESAQPSGIDDARKKLLRKFESEPTAETLMELRRLFLGARAYQEAVRTFRQLLVDPKNQKFMPAVCLLVGEFYKLAGRQEESSFYLANPLIRDDPFARELIQKIKEAAAK